MKIEEHRTNHQFENILPLVNVVFLLLIFFMVAGAFSSPEIFKVDAPYAQSELAADRGVLTILMDQQGQLAVDDEIVSKENIVQLVQQHVLFNKNTKVQLKADANSSAVDVVDIMELVSRTDIDVIHLLTTGSIQ